MEILLAVWMFMLNTGTNVAFIKFVTGNVLLLAFVAFVTPWTWDNRIVGWLKSNVLRKKEEVKDEEIK